MGTERKFPPVTGVVSLENIRMSAELMIDSSEEISQARQAGLLIRSLAIHIERVAARQNDIAGEVEKIKAHLQM